MQIPIGVPPLKRPQGDGISKPKRLKDVPSYLYKKAKGFLTRLFYIIGLVWQASPIVLIALSLFCILDGLLPVVGAYISSELLNGIAKLIGAGGVAAGDDVFVILSPVLFLFILQMVHHFLKRILGRVNTMVTSIAGELVVNHIKLMIINKAKTVDQRSFDSPSFYEKLENANREAGMRPIQILNSTFNIVSALISVVSFITILG